MVHQNARVTGGRSSRGRVGAAGDEHKSFHLPIQSRKAHNSGRINVHVADACSSQARRADHFGRRGGPLVARPKAIVAAALTVVALAAAACSSSSTAPNGSSSASDPSSPRVSSSASTSSDPTVTTASVEQVVQAAWLNYWKVALSFESTASANDWPQAVAAVAVNPIRNQLILGASKDRLENLVGYGYIVSRPYWPTAAEAHSQKVVMGDCFDGTRAGLKFKKTGRTHSVGTPRTNVHATLVKGADGKWRVEQIEYLKASC